MDLSSSNKKKRKRKLSAEARSRKFNKYMAKKMRSSPHLQVQAPEPAKGDTIAINCRIIMLDKGPKFMDDVDCQKEYIMASVAIVDVLQRVVYEASFPLPPDVKPLVAGRCRHECLKDFLLPGPSHESVLEQLSAILTDWVVVGFAIKDDLEVLGVSNSLTENITDVQTFFNKERCSEPDISGTGLPKLDDGESHKLMNLTQYLLGHSPPADSSRAALMDAKATMELYLKFRGEIERRSGSGPIAR